MVQRTVCQVNGNPDLYGIGIRIGLYLQWVSTLLISIFIPKEVRTTRAVNLWIQSAIFLGLLLLVTSQDATPAEVLIALWLLCGSLSSLTGNGMSSLAKLSGLFRIFFYIALSSFGIWYWFVGLDGFLQPDCYVVAFFGNVSIDGRFRTLCKAVSCLGLAACVASIGVWIALVKSRAASEGDGQRPRAEMARQPFRIEIGLLITSVALIIVSIAGVEYLITTNEIQNVGDTLSVGQLIPLLAGSFSIASTAREVVTKDIFTKRRCWFLLGHHL
ncbi:hypothetical protein AA0114_g12823 [Alternaria tenuissima]|uniref:Uncharacterized protein n=1 Tax=Alternaria tenuissima TaxID=119927 RepID=A0A4Q4LY57_9PLEO|nr:hypothetical protein AA0114_g12823 [Alternaria tenuissima]